VFSFANSGVSYTIIFCLVGDIINMSNSDDSCYSSLSEDEIIMYGLESGLDRLSLSQSSKEVQYDSTENDDDDDDSEAEESGYQTDESCLEEVEEEGQNSCCEADQYDNNDVVEIQSAGVASETNSIISDAVSINVQDNNDVVGIQSASVASETNSVVSDDAISIDVEMLELTQAACCNDSEQCVMSYDDCD